MEGSVRRKGSKWYYSFEGPKINGKRKRYERVGGDTKQKALDALRKALNEFEEAGNIFDPTEASVHDYFNFWYEDYVVRNLKYNTQENYRHTMELHILPYIGKYKLKAITPANLQRILDSEFEKGFAKSTVQIIKTVLNTAFKHAVYPYQFIKQSPTQYIKVPKYDVRVGKTRDSLKIFSLEDFKKMNEHVVQASDFYIPMHIAFHTGMRRGEVCGLTWDDISFEDETIKIEKIMIMKRGTKYSIDTPKTQSSYRTISIGQTLINILKKHKLKQSENRLFYGKQYHESNFVCTKPNGNPITPSIIKWHCERIRTETDIDFTFHSFRHTHATMLLENGAKMKDVKDRLGHSRISTTMDIYSHITKKSKRETVAIFENYLQNE